MTCKNKRPRTFRHVIPTEATATAALQDRLYFGVGKKFLGFQIADEVIQDDGSWKKLGKDGFRHWTVPVEEMLRRRWHPVHDHLKGLHRGLVAIGSSHVPFVAADFDRHWASVDPHDHMWRVMKAGRLLRKHFPQFCWIAEVNSLNGSMKFFGFGNGPIPIAEAQKVATRIHEILLEHGCGAVNRQGKQEVEVFPHNCVQVGLPMRTDKVTIISSGILEKCIRRRKDQDGVFEKFQTYSALAFCRALADMGCYNELTLLSELKKACANLPFVPVTKLSIPVIAMSPDQPQVVAITSDVPRSTGDYQDNPNAYERQQDALLELCRRIGRVATVNEGLEFIRGNGLFSGEWADNEARRRCRVKYLLGRIAMTFDKTKCNEGNDPLRIREVNVGKYDNWARSFVGKVTGARRHVDEYGNVVERRSASVDWKWVSVFLSVVEHCCVTCPNQDGSLPQNRAEYIWSVLKNLGRISSKWDEQKWKVARDWLERRGVIRIVDRKWRFGHGNGQAMKWAVGDGFDRLHIWWKTVRESSGNPAVALDVFLGNMLHTPSLNSYPHKAEPEMAIPSRDSSSRGPPGGEL